MSNVLTVLEVDCDADGLCFVVADVDDVLVTNKASLLDPEEYGSALCRSAFYLQDDEVIPDNDGDLLAFIEARVSNWEPLDLSDLYGTCEDSP
jgi:hypothetical protein